MVKPIKITTWQCPICKTICNDEQDAIACSNLPTPEHQFKVGEIVYIEERYPDNPEKPFVAVKISELYGFTRDTFPDSHAPQYLLEEAIRVGKYCLTGRPESECDGDQYHPAYEWELYKLGDKYLGETLLTEDLVGQYY
jgi:hypothetical protein